MDPTKATSVARMAVYVVDSVRQRAEGARNQAYRFAAELDEEVERLAALRAEVEALAVEAEQWKEGSQEDYAARVFTLFAAWYEGRMSAAPADLRSAEQAKELFDAVEGRDSSGG